MRLSLLMLILLSHSTFGAPVCPPHETLGEWNCDLQCHLQFLRKIFRVLTKRFHCAKHCKQHDLAVTFAAESVYACLKGGTWDIAKGVVLTPFTLWQLIETQATNRNAFDKYCDNDKTLECKRQLAG